MSKNGRRATTGTFAVALGVLIGAVLQGGIFSTPAVFASDRAYDAATAAVLAEPRAAIVSTRDLSTAFADLAEMATPAVVQINVTTRVRAAESQGSSPQIPEQFRRFFDQQPGSGSPAPDALRRGGGSGFVISSDGYIVTNDHVVGDAEQIIVQLSDHRAFDATLVGTDPTTDVAVIKIEATGLRALEWGSSTQLRVGEWVLAIGNPGVGGGQLESTVTTGIVSAKGRPLQLIARGLADDPRYGAEMAGYAIENFIQTDAVINPGNSGGPMLDLDGHVVGVNSAIASTDGAYQGYGFAIPSDLVRRVAADLMEDGEVHRPWLGVQVVAIAAEDAEAFGLPTVSGVLVQGVTPDSPAEETGLRQGDVIVSVNQEPVATGGDLQEHIAILAQGDRARIGFYRDGKLLSENVTLGAAPTSAAAGVTRSSRGSDMAAEGLGISVAPLDAATSSRLGFEKAGGVVVSDVDPIGPAASRGVVPGVRLTRVGRTEVSSMADVSRALVDVAPGQVVTLVVESPDGVTRIVNVRAR